MNWLSGSHRTPRRAALLLAAAGVFAFGCNLVVGTYDFREDPADADTRDVAIDVLEPVSDAGCDVDLTRTCYACEPATNDQFLNACGESPCTPFDRTRLDGLLLPDGALPPLPQPEGGT
jgi:hypothetical protein